MQVNATEATEQIRQSREAIEALEPKGHPDRTLTFKGWKLPDGRDAGDRTYTQAELGMFPAQELVTIISEIVDQFTEGEMGLKIGDLFRGDVVLPTNFDADAVDAVVEENIQLVKAIIKLIRVLPEFQLDIITLSLGVPRRERQWVKECLQEPPHRGGLKVDEAFDIFIVFVKQNAPLIKETFSGKASELVEVFQLEIMDLSPVEDSSDSTDSASSPSGIDPQPASPGGTPSSTSSQPTPEHV